ncbi:hypothetical protein FKM82_025832 [Ascaphus truei]
MCNHKYILAEMGKRRKRRRDCRRESSLPLCYKPDAISCDNLKWKETSTYAIVCVQLSYSPRSLLPVYISCVNIYKDASDVRSITFLQKLQSYI